MIAMKAKPTPGRVPPHSVKAEESMIAAILLDGGESLQSAQAAGIKPASFYVPANGVIFATIEAMQAEGVPLEAVNLFERLRDIGKLDAVGGLGYVVRVTREAASVVNFQHMVRQVRFHAERRQVIEAMTKAVENAYEAKDYEDLGQSLAGLREVGAGATPLAERLRASLISFEAPPKEPEARWFIDRKPIATPGNITAIIAQAKAGKTTWAAALLAAVMVADREARGMEAGTFDTLGAQAADPKGRVIVYVDTEQTRYDGYRSFKRACNRAGLDMPPGWVRLYSLKGWSAKDAREAVRQILRDCARKGIRVFAVIVDGLADLCVDVNDAPESNELVCEMEAHAVAADCPVVCVIHRNEGGKADSAARGHLGKQLARKAETNLRLEKRDGKTVVFADQNRGAPITERDGPCFEWSEKHMCHVSSVNIGKSREDAEADELRVRVSSLFQGKGELRWSEINAALIADFGRSKNSAERDIKRMRALNLIIPGQTSGKFTPNPQITPTQPPTM